MESFHMISLTACFLGIVITIFSRLYPSEKFEKQMKTIFSLVFIVSIVTPFVNGRIELPAISDTVTASTEHYRSISDNADEYFIKSVENNLSVRLKSELNSRNIFPLEIQTNVNISTDNSIFISEVNVIMSEAGFEGEIKSCIETNIGNEAIINVKTKDGLYGD